MALYWWPKKAEGNSTRRLNLKKQNTGQAIRGGGVVSASYSQERGEIIGGHFFAASD